MESLKSIKKESAVTHGRSRRPEIATYFIVVTRRPSLNPQTRCRRITDWPRTNLGEKSGLGASTEILIHHPTGRRCEQILHATIGYVGLPKPGRNGEAFVRA